jgi:hypothetical protein
MIAMVVMVMGLYLRGISGDCRKTPASPPPPFCAALPWWAGALPTLPNDERALPPDAAWSERGQQKWKLVLPPTALTRCDLAHNRTAARIPLGLIVR